MPSDSETPLSTTRRSNASSRWRLRHRRRQMSTVHLGGKKSRGRLLVVSLYRRAKLKWLKAKFSRALKKLKSGYDSLVKDLSVENGRGSLIESLQQRMVLESSLTIPVMGFSFYNYTASTTR